MKKYVLILIICLLEVISLAKSIDSLEMELKNSKKLSSRNVNALRLELAQEYMQVNEYAKSLSLLTEALKEYEKNLNDPLHYADLLARTADVYNYLQNSEKSIFYYRKSLKILRTLSEKKIYSTLITNLNNMGLVYHQINFQDSSSSCYREALELSRKYNHLPGLTLSLGNIGYQLEMGGRFEEALEYYIESYDVAKQMKNKKGIIFNLNNLGFVHTALQNFDSAETYFYQAAELAEVNGMKDILRDSYEGLTQLYRVQGNLQKALEYQQNLNLIFDSLYQADISKQILEMNTKYESEKKDKELLRRKAEADQKKMEAEQNARERNYLLIGLILIGVLALFIFRGYQQKKKSNQLISFQKTEVEKQKHVIEEKNKDISDSINYAQRIQQSFLGSNEEFQKAFKDYFILYKPKDIISGDCYWIANVNTTPKNEAPRRISVVAAIDCTGHGIPGALMSIVGMTLLNQTTKNTEINSCADALNYLNRELPKNIKSDNMNQQVRDGMDMSMCTFFHDKLEMAFAGANNPVYLVRQGELTVLKADKQAVSSATDIEKNDFSQQMISLQKDDCVYMFTDGFADQFGGEKRKKFTYKRFQEKLIELHSLPMAEQKNELTNVFNSWKGEQEQIDDVLVIGIRIS